MRFVRFAAGLAIVGSLLAAGCECPCGQHESAASTTEKRPGKTSPADVANATVITSNDGAYRIAFVTTPSPIPLNELFEIDARVTNADGSPLADDATVGVDAAMPQHGHGMNTAPKVERREDGTFHVRGMLFHMSGDWEIYFDVSQAGVTERAQAEITLE